MPVVATSLQVWSTAGWPYRGPWTSGSGIVRLPARAIMLFHLLAEQRGGGRQEIDPGVVAIDLLEPRKEEAEAQGGVKVVLVEDEALGGLDDDFDRLSNLTGTPERPNALEHRRQLGHQRGRHGD